MKQSTVLTIFLIIFFACCGSEPDTPFRQYTHDDGYTVVENAEPLWQSDPKIRLEFSHKIGGLEISDENLLFYSVKDIEFDDQGNMYILDMGNCRIVKMNQSGEVVETIGRKGQGPGEFQLPASIDFSGDGALLVADPRGRIVHYFSPERDNVRILRNIRAQYIYDVYFLDENRIALLTRDMDENPLKFGPVQPLIKVVDLDSRMLHEFVEPAEYPTYQAMNNMNSAFMTVDAGSIYITFGRQNRIEKYSFTGELMLRITRSFDFELYPMEYDKKTRKMTNFGSKVSSAIAIDQSGRIWVCAYSKQPTHPDLQGNDLPNAVNKELKARTDLQCMEVYEPSGRLLCRIPLSENVQHFKIHQDKLYIIPHNAVDIRVYNIIDESDQTG